MTFVVSTLAALALIVGGFALPDSAEARARQPERSKAKQAAKSKAKQRNKSQQASASGQSGQGQGRGQGHASQGQGRGRRQQGQGHASQGQGRQGQNPGHASQGQGHQGQQQGNGRARQGHGRQDQGHSSQATAPRARQRHRGQHSTGHHTTQPTYRRDHATVRYSPYYRPYRPYRRVVVTTPGATYYAAPAPTYVETPAPRPSYNDGFDLGLGLGVVASTPQLVSGLPMVNGKIRMLGQLDERLGLGIDFDAASLLWVNHATASLVASYDLLGGTPVALRPYASVGGGVLHVFDATGSFLGPAVSARAGIELKPIRWLGLSLEAGAIAGRDDGTTLTVPYAGGMLTLYLL